MDTASSVIDQMDHHPDWKHVDNEVDVRLSTHDAGNNVSLKDIILARSMVIFNFKSPPQYLSLQDHIANQLANHHPVSALNPNPLNLDSVATDAFSEETLEKERYVPKAAREDRWIRRFPDSRDEVADRSSKQEETSVQTQKKPADKHGDSASSDHYTQKTNL